MGSRAGKRHAERRKSFGSEEQWWAVSFVETIKGNGCCVVPREVYTLIFL